MAKAIGRHDIHSKEFFVRRFERFESLFHLGHAIFLRPTVSNRLARNPFQIPIEHLLPRGSHRCQTETTSEFRSLSVKMAGLVT